MTEPIEPGKNFPALTKPGEVVRFITQTLESLAGDDAYRQGVTRFVPGAGVVYGVRVPRLRELAGQIRKVYRSQPELVVEIAKQCWQVASREHCVLAILILSGMKSLTPAQRWELGLHFLPGVRDWETCDQLCMGLLGQALAEDVHYMDKLEDWIQAENVWFRRACLASTVVLRRAKFELETLLSLNQRTLSICLSLLDDREHYVRTAVDWAVREVIGRNYDLGRQWLMDRTGSELTSVARSTLKKAAKKLRAEDQEHFLQCLG